MVQEQANVKGNVVTWEDSTTYPRMKLFWKKFGDMVKKLTGCQLTDNPLVLLFPWSK